MFGLGRQKLSADEAFSWAASRLSLSEVVRLAFNESHPPLYHILLKATLLLLPRTEFGLRFLSFLCSVTTLAVVLRLTRRWWGERAALYAGILVALSPVEIYYAQDNRMYALLACQWILSFVLLVELLSGSRKDLVLPWSCTCAALLWTHGYGWIAVAIQLAFAIRHLLSRWAHRPGRWSFEGWLAAGILLILAAWAPLLLLWHLDQGIARAGGPVMAQLVEIPSLLKFWVAGPLPGRAENYPYGEGLLTLLRLREYAIPLSLLSIGAGCLLLLVQASSHRPPVGRHVRILGLALVLMPAILVYAFAAATGKRIWLDRGFTGCGVLLLTMAGMGISGLASRAVRGALLAAILTMDLLSLLPYATVWQKNANAAALAFLPRPGDGSLILITPPWHSLEVYYYMGTDTPLLGMDGLSGELYRLGLRSIEIPAADPVDCGAPELAGASDVYLFGPDVWRAPGILGRLPSCLDDKRLWRFERERWVPAENPHRNPRS